MKKIAFLLLIIGINTHAEFKINTHDLVVGGISLGAGLAIAAVGSHYWHPAAAARARIEAEQEDKRVKEQKEREEKQKAEAVEKDRVRATIEFTKSRQEYDLEINELQKQHGLSREKFIAIVKGKHTSNLSRFKDYYESLINNIKYLHSISVLLSADERAQLENFTADLKKLKKEFNLKLTEDIRAEEEDAKRAKRHEQAELRRIEREELENKKLRGEVEAQKMVKEIHEAVKNFPQEMQTIVRREIANSDNKANLQFTAVTRQLNLMMETIKEAIAAGNAQFANRLSALFIKELEKAKNTVQAAMQNQAAQPVIVSQAPPPFNPAAMRAAPSEAVDAMPNPPPTYV